MTLIFFIALIISASIRQVSVWLMAIFGEIKAYLPYPQYLEQETSNHNDQNWHTSKLGWTWTILLFTSPHFQWVSTILSLLPHTHPQPSVYSQSHYLRLTHQFSKWILRYNLFCILLPGNHFIKNPHSLLSFVLQTGFHDSQLLNVLLSILTFSWTIVRIYH